LNKPSREKLQKIRRKTIQTAHKMDVARGLATATVREKRRLLVGLTLKFADLDRNERIR